MKCPLHPTLLSDSLDFRDSPRLAPGQTLAPIPIARARVYENHRKMQSGCQRCAVGSENGFTSSSERIEPSGPWPPPRRRHQPGQPRTAPAARAPPAPPTPRHPLRVAWKAGPVGSLPCRASPPCIRMARELSEGTPARRRRSSQPREPPRAMDPPFAYQLDHVQERERDLIHHLGPCHPRRASNAC